MPTLSKLSDKCKKCEYVTDCDNKRMVACAIAEMPTLETGKSTMPLIERISMPVTRKHTPIAINMGEYGTIETSLEEINEKIKKDLQKQLYCGFNR